MSIRLKDRLANSTPLRIVEYIIAFSTLLGGLVLFTPLVLIPVPGVGDPEVAAAILSRPGIIGVGIFAVVAALMHIYGLVRNKITWRTNGLFLNALVRIYAMLASYLVSTTEAWMPWEANVALLLMVIILWFWHRLAPERTK